MHDEMMIAPGVYITDFRKNQQLVGLDKPKHELSNDIGLLVDNCISLDSKSKKLQQSILQIQQQQNWQADEDFSKAVEQNWDVIIRMSQELKQLILKLQELKYKPQTDKLEEILSIQKIEQRQKNARIQLQLLQPPQTQSIYL